MKKLYFLLLIGVTAISAFGFVTIKSENPTAEDKPIVVKLGAEKSGYTETIKL